MALSFNKEVISEAIQEVLAEITKDYTLTTKSGQKIHMPFKTSADAKKYATNNSNIQSAEETMEEDHHENPNDDSDMAKSQLYAIAKYAIELLQMIKDGDPLDAWVQAKITKAADYVDAVQHYLEGEEYLDANQEESEEGLDEARDYQALVGKTVQYGGRRATVEGEEGDYIRLKFEDGKENLVSKSDFENKEPYVNEDDDVEPSKKDIKAAEKDVKNVSDDKKQQFNRALAFIKKFKDNPGAVAGMLKKAKEEYKLPKNLLKDLARAAQVSETLAEGVSCCGRCGRVHESAQDCKKPYISKDSPRHCKNKK